MVEEDWGVGAFTFTDIDFQMTMKPYLLNNNVRLMILEDTLNFGDYKYTIRVKDNSKFNEILERFASVFSEHMR